MTFERTHDYAFVQRVLTDPRIWRAISDDFSPPRDEFTPIESDAVWYIAVHDDTVHLNSMPELLGVFVFVPQNAVCWEVHTCLLPNAWGERAAQAAREMSEWIWANTGCRRIVTSVPAYNRLALRFAKQAGMTEWGVNLNAYQKFGELFSLHMLGISPSE